MLALMMMALSGTLYIYQGQELGMVNFPLDWSMEEYKDVDSTNYASGHCFQNHRVNQLMCQQYHMVEKRSHGNAKALHSAKVALPHLARDHARVPMQWNASPHGGFSTVKPWMRVNDDYTQCNAQQQQTDTRSVLAFWKRMLVLRKEHRDLFVYGNFELVDEADEDLFCFTKEWDGEKALVVLNFTGEQQAFGVDDFVGEEIEATLLSATVDEVRESSLSPYEGRVYLISV